MFSLPLLAALLPLDSQGISEENQVRLQNPSIQAGSCSEFKSYTALGDSYAVGYGSKQRLGLCTDAEPIGTPDCTTDLCGKDIGAYAYQFWQEYGIHDFQYVACSSANTTEVLNGQINAANFGEPDLVTINVGGDDGHIFGDAVLVCAYKYDNEKCEAALTLAESVIFGELRASLETLFPVLESRTVSNSAKVVVMGYAQFWPVAVQHPCLWDTTTEQKARMNKLVLELNSALRNAALAASFLFADVDSAFANHRFCDTGTRWFQELPTVGRDSKKEWYNQTGVFHPKIEGEVAYLAVLKETLGC